MIIGPPPKFHGTWDILVRRPLHREQAPTVELVRLAQRALRRLIRGDGCLLFSGSFLGTPIVNLWARTLDVKIGKEVWLESHWLPETDLIRLGAGVIVNRGCVLQTHLFHDRLMRISSVHLGAGSSLGPRSITLPGTSIGAGTSIGPGSLVMRGEHVPAGTRWAGNPITAIKPRPTGGAAGQPAPDTGRPDGGGGQRTAFNLSDRPPIPPRRPRAHGPAALPLPYPDALGVDA